MTILRQKQLLEQLESNNRPQEAAKEPSENKDDMEQTSSKPKLKKGGRTGLSK